MRILLVGCVQSSKLFLEKLIEIDANIVGVVTKKESKQNADFVDLGIICEKYQIDYKYINHINDIEAKEYIASKNIDLLLCLGWSQLLDNEVLSIPKLGCIGFHPAKLPKNKGRHPLIWALALGLNETASTFFLMDSGADSGKIISQHTVEIKYDDDATSLYSKVMKIAIEQLAQIVQDYNNMVKYLPNSCELGNTWRKRGKNDGVIDWRMSSRGIYNLVRALTKPYVGAHFVYKGHEYIVWKVRERIEEGYENIEPGKVISVYSPSHFVVKVGDNLIEIIDCEKVSVEVGEYL